MHRARRVPAAHENEHTNEEIEQTDKPAVIFNGRGFFRGRGSDGSFELPAVADQFVAHLRPQTGMPQAASDLHLGSDGDAVYGDQQIAWANSGASGGGGWS